MQEEREEVMEDGVGRSRLLLLLRLGGAGATGEAAQMYRRRFHVVVAEAEILQGGIETLIGRRGEFLLHDVIPRHTEGGGIGEGEEAKEHLRDRDRAREHPLEGRDTTKILHGFFVTYVGCEY